MKASGKPSHQMQVDRMANILFVTKWLRWTSPLLQCSSSHYTFKEWSGGTNRARSGRRWRRYTHACCWRYTGRRGRRSASLHGTPDGCRWSSVPPSDERSHLVHHVIKNWLSKWWRFSTFYWNWTLGNVYITVVYGSIHRRTHDFTLEGVHVVGGRAGGLGNEWMNE